MTLADLKKLSDDELKSLLINVQGEAYRRQNKKEVYFCLLPNDNETVAFGVVKKTVYFGVVEKSYWEEHKAFDDCCNIETPPEFGWSMEAVLDYCGSEEEGRAALVACGFIEKPDMVDV